LTYAEIVKRIDYAITKGYLAIEYLGRLPVLTFTAAGWEIEQNTYSDELLMKLRQLAIGPVQTTDIEFLKGKNRSLIMMLLDKIEAGKDNKLLSVLEEWRKTDYKKVRNRISEVIQSVESPKETVEKP
jgi:formate dehydrogenase maturation protein FdhE